MMSRTLMAAAVVLVAGSPLAFAANNGINMNASDLTTKHCSYLDQEFSQTKFKSEAARQIAEEKTSSLCREDRHKNGGAQAQGGQDGARGVSRRG